MTRAVALMLLTMFALACNEIEPPTQIDPAVTDEQRLVIQDALDHTCRAVHFCPDVVDHASSVVHAVTEMPKACADLVGCNAVGEIYLDMSILDRWNLDVFWVVVAHELLHYGEEGHTKSGLMDDFHTDPSSEPACIDLASAQAWCDQQGGTDCRSTCPEG